VIGFVSFLHILLDAVFSMSLLLFSPLIVCLWTDGFYLFGRSSDGGHHYIFCSESPHPLTSSREVPSPMLSLARCVFSLSSSIFWSNEREETIPSRSGSCFPHLGLQSTHKTYLLILRIVSSSFFFYCRYAGVVLRRFFRAERIFQRCIQS